MNLFGKKPKSVKDICPLAALGGCGQAGCAACVIHSANEDECECRGYRESMRMRDRAIFLGFLAGVMFCIILIFVLTRC